MMSCFEFRHLSEHFFNFHLFEMENSAKHIIFCCKITSMRELAKLNPTLNEAHFSLI